MSHSHNRPESFSGEELKTAGHISFPPQGEFRKRRPNSLLPQALQCGAFISRTGETPLLQDWDNTGQRIRNTGVLEVSPTEPSTPVKGLVWLDTAKNLRGAVETFTADTTLTPANDVVCGDALSRPIVFTLPPIKDKKGKQFDISKGDSTKNTATIVPNGSETVAGGRELVIRIKGDSYTLVNDNVSNWMIL